MWNKLPISNTMNFMHLVNSRKLSSGSTLNVTSSITVVGISGDTLRCTGINMKYLIIDGLWNTVRRNLTWIYPSTSIVYQSASNSLRHSPEDGLTGAALLGNSEWWNAAPQDSAGVAWWSKRKSTVWSWKGGKEIAEEWHPINFGCQFLNTPWRDKAFRL